MATYLNNDIDFDVYMEQPERKEEQRRFGSFVKFFIV